MEKILSSKLHSGGTSALNVFEQRSDYRPKSLPIVQLMLRYGNFADLDPSNIANTLNDVDAFPNRRKAVVYLFDLPGVREKLTELVTTEPRLYEETLLDEGLYVPNNSTVRLTLFYWSQ